MFGKEVSFVKQAELAVDAAAPVTRAISRKKLHGENVERLTEKSHKTLCSSVPSLCNFFLILVYPG